MATLGQDAEVILDNNGFFVQPGTYVCKWPRIRKATVRADGGEGYVDLGPGKRVWSMVILCVNDLVKYDGTSTGLTGQNYRDSLIASYSKVAQTVTLSGAALARCRTVIRGWQGEQSETLTGRGNTESLS